tara:strand:- start:150 stop:287 length:138 start_codon:yes stop_codon:yes gene_type:complete
MTEMRLFGYGYQPLLEFFLELLMVLQITLEFLAGSIDPGLDDAHM